MEFGIPGLLVAILGGAAVGVERQRSGHATGPGARLGGIRTFTLFGTLSGLSGGLIAAGYLLPAAAILGGATALVIAAYVRASRHDVDATTEVAALVVLGAGTLAGLGELRISAGLTTLTVLLLAEKTRIHGAVRKIDDVTLLAAARFAVMSLVILPLLPAGPIGPPPGVRPRELWMLVLLFSGLSFVGYIAQRLAGAAGHALTGLIGGLVSSTSVTLGFSRTSGNHQAQSPALATGVAAACTVLFVRVAVAVAVLNAALLPALARLLVPSFITGVVVVSVLWWTMKDAHPNTGELKNPLQFRSALEMAGLFQVVLIAIHFVRASVGDLGVMASGAVLGLTDVDALTVAMTRMGAAAVPADLAARAIAVGVFSNTLLKMAVAVTVGAKPFKWRVALALAAIAAPLAGMLMMSAG